ncbi:MAG TPA: transporter substrate-binding domain-containing protein [Thermodesulfobacteriota bacterium]
MEAPAPGVGGKTGASMEGLMRIRFGALALALLVGLVAGRPAFAADRLAEVKQKGKLVVGFEGTYPPYNFKDRDGAFKGYDVDVANAIAKKLGVKAEFVATEWAGIIAGLLSDRYDVIVAQMTVNEERKKQVDFSEPYTIYGPMLIVHKDNTTIKSYKDLDGKTLGVTLGTNFEKRANGWRQEGIEVEVRTYPGMNEYLSDLAAKRIDAAMTDAVAPAIAIREKKLPLKQVGGPIEREVQAIAVKKGNPELLAAINKALEEMKADGSLRAMSLKWFGIDVTK